jgi:hypothetical protein
MEPFSTFIGAIGLSCHLEKLAWQPWIADDDASPSSENLNALVPFMDRNILNTFEFYECEIGDIIFKRLSPVLSGQSNLKRLSLHKNNLSSASLCRLFNVLEFNRSLESLYLSGNGPVE